jgi:hypothetical protein
MSILRRAELVVAVLAADGLAVAGHDMTRSIDRQERIFSGRCLGRWPTRQRLQSIG